MKWLDWLPPGLMLAGVALVLDAGSGEAALGLLLALTAVVSLCKDSLRYKHLRHSHGLAVVVVDGERALDEWAVVRGEALDKAVDDASAHTLVNRS